MSNSTVQVSGPAVFVADTQVKGQMQSAMIDERSHTSATHLIRVDESGFHFWRWACLRSAGFPLDGILQLAASPRLIISADEVINAMEVMERAQQKTHSEIDAALDLLRSSGHWDDKKKRKALLKARAAVNSMKVSGSFEAVHLDTIEDFKEAICRLDAARDCFRTRFSESEKQTTESIRQIVALPAFREAVMWQNRPVVQGALDLLLRKESNGSRNSHQRQHEELVANYWQRYCVKNDTIGFFGPVGWVQFVAETVCLTAKPGEQLMTARKTYWEAWAMEALGSAILKKHNAQPWVPPILMPFIHVAGDAVSHPILGRMQLPDDQSLLLRSCNGQDTAKEIAAAILLLPNSRFRTESEVYQALRELADKRFISWTFNIPMGPHPEKALRAALQRIGDPIVRQSTMDMLNELESAQYNVSAAAGNPDKLNAAFAVLEKTFLRLTGLPPVRHQGQVYAGRTLIYEDCCRDVEIHLGSQLLQSFVRPLSLLLVAGRWFASRLTEVYKNELWEIYSKHFQSAGNSSVEASVLWTSMSPLFFDRAAKLVAPIQEEFTRKWEKILQFGQSHGPVAYSSDQLSQLVAKEFASSGSGWISARYHSPDVMIAATDEEAIRRGDCFFVLGEAHMTKNTLEASLFVNQHPSPDVLLSAVEHDLGILNLVPVGASKDELGCRTTPSLISKSSFLLEYLPNVFVSDRARSVPISSMVVENQQGELMAKSRDGRFGARLIDLVGPLLSDLVFDCFKIVAPRPHTARISIDRLVIKRESWRFSPSELQFACCLDAAEMFLQVRIWAKANGIPRFSFFKVPTEEKPTYLDLESPILVAIFVRLIRRTMEAGFPDASIEVSEMLPTVGQVWLMDKDKRRYTSELRMVAVGPRSCT